MSQHHLHDKSPNKAQHPADNQETPADLRKAPHSLGAEKGVLGSILLDPNRVVDLCITAGITPESFYFDTHRRLYAELAAMHHAQHPIDLLTVVEQLRGTNRLDALGGIAFLEGLVDATPTAAHAEYYIDVMRQKHLVRSVIDCANKTLTLCYESNQSATLIVGEAEQAFMNITSTRQEWAVEWPMAIQNAMLQIDRQFQSDPGSILGLPSGFKTLDKKLRGLKAGEIIVLAARPSMGKTSLAMNMAECIAMGRHMTGNQLKGEHGRTHAVGVFSLEMPQDQLVMRMLCGRAGVPGYMIDNGMVNPQKVNQQLTRAASELTRAPLLVDDTGGLDIMELRSRARRMKKKHNIELIVVDYLQLLNCREMSRQGRQLEIAAVSGHLKAMAKELKVPVLVLSQLSRAPEQRGDKTAKPKLSDLRDSGAIEQDADVVLLLRRPSRIPGDPETTDKLLAIVDIAKNRNGPIGEVRMNFEDSLTRFADRAEDRLVDDVPDDDPVG